MLAGGRRRTVVVAGKAPVLMMAVVDTVTWVREEQRLAGRATEVREEQPLKAAWPTEVRLLGQATDTRAVLPSNAQSGRCVRLQAARLARR